MPFDNIRSFLQLLSVNPYSNREAMLAELQDKELAKKPTFLGKRKSKQIESLLQAIER
jgi:hypothetical protein